MNSTCSTLLYIPPHHYPWCPGFDPRPVSRAVKRFILSLICSFVRNNITAWICFSCYCSCGVPLCEAFAKDDCVSDLSWNLIKQRLYARLRRIDLHTDCSYNNCYNQVVMYSNVLFVVNFEVIQLTEFANWGPVRTRPYFCLQRQNLSTVVSIITWAAWQTDIGCGRIRRVN